MHPASPEFPGYREHEEIFVDWKLFAWMFGIGTAATALQGYVAYKGGWWSQSQIYEVHKLRKAYSFLQHGAMYTNLIFLNAAAAYVMGSYKLKLVSWSGAGLALITVAVTVFMLNEWRQLALATPEAHSETSAGAIHAVYMGMMMWIFLMYFVGDASPPPGRDMIAIAVVITVNSFFGVIKFSPRWSWATPAIIQVLVPTAFVWGVTIVKLWR